MSDDELKVILEVFARSLEAHVAAIAKLLAVAEQRAQLIAALSERIIALESVVNQITATHS